MNQKTFALRRSLGAATVLALLAGAGQAQGAPGNAPGFDGQTIQVGYIGPLTGPVAVLGQPVLTGMQVFFEAVNAQGGIAGRYKVKVLTEDHQNTEAQAVQKYAKQKGGVVTGAMFGTHTTKAVLPELRRDRFVMAPAGFEGFMIKDPNLLPIGSTYELMAINSVDYLVHKGGRKDANFCALVRDDPFGLAGLKGWKFALEKSGKKVVETTYLGQADKDFTGQVNQMKNAKCEVVLVTTVPGQLVSIVGSAARAGFAPQWVGQWPSWHGALLNTPVVDYLEKNVMIAGEGVEWGGTNAPGVAPMLADIARYRPEQKPDLWVVVGYTQARAMTAMLEKAVANGDLSREGVMKALTQLGEVDNQGLSGNYTYGPIAGRAPAMAGSIFRINRHKPFGLEGVEMNYTSPLVRSYVFDDETKK
ncbi:MAG TPA: ABC transporter substrate-binding protein [Pseudorhodoferax sp.]|jgi:ABC-type branched-subunit amino acid transport system substrate-binding protein|nr:ABC transporter substrate-binding protein [Pseudorhodoferax sp.]